MIFTSKKTPVLIDVLSETSYREFYNDLTYSNINGTILQKSTPAAKIIAAVVSEISSMRIRTKLKT